MTDSKSVVQEVQKELLAALQRANEQVRKGQERVRKSQEQARKSRDAVVSVVRAGNELVKAARPSAPTLPNVHIPGPAAMRAHAQELAGQAITAQRDLAAKAVHAASPYAERVLTAQREMADRARHAASPYADHVAAAQRSLAERFIEVAKIATPIVAEGRTRLTQLVGVLQPGHPTARAADETPLDVASAQAATAQPTAHKDAQPAAPEAETPAKPRARTTSKTSTTKVGPAKASTAKASPAKASTAKASPAKASTTKATKPRSAPKK